MCVAITSCSRPDTDVYVYIAMRINVAELPQVVLPSLVHETRSYLGLGCGRVGDSSVTYGMIRSHWS